MEQNTLTNGYTKSVQSYGFVCCTGALKTSFRCQKMNHTILPVTKASIADERMVAYLSNSVSHSNDYSTDQWMIFHKEVVNGILYVKINNFRIQENS